MQSMGGFSRFAIVLILITVLPHGNASDRPERRDPPAQGEASDENGPPELLPAWVPDDRLLHVVGGFAAGMLTSAAAAAFLDSESRGWTYAVAGAAFLGSGGAAAAKEAVDILGFGLVEWKDVGFTLLGGIVAAGFVAAILPAFEGFPDDGANAARFFTAVGIGWSIPLAPPLAVKAGILLSSPASQPSLTSHH